MMSEEEPNAFAKNDNKLIQLEAEMLSLIYTRIPLLFIYLKVTKSMATSLCIKNYLTNLK
jgi:hypothetical protein